MSEQRKLIVALEAHTPAAIDAFVDWARGEAAGGAMARAEVETLEPDAHAAHTTKPAAYGAFASFWIVDGDVEGVARRAPGPTAWFLVRDRLAFDRSARADEARPWVGIKKTTPWAAVDGVDRALWQGRYTNHGVLTAAYHATCVRYRQNVVLAASRPDISAVSELWWTNVEDLVERFYLSPEAQQLVGYDTAGFVDTARAYPVVTTHVTLRAGAVTSSRGFLPDETG